MGYAESDDPLKRVTTSTTKTTGAATHSDHGNDKADEDYATEGPIAPHDDDDFDYDKYQPAQ